MASKGEQSQSQMILPGEAILCLAVAKVASACSSSQRRSPSNDCINVYVKIGFCAPMCITSLHTCRHWTSFGILPVSCHSVDASKCVRISSGEPEPETSWDSTQIVVSLGCLALRFQQSQTHNTLKCSVIINIFSHILDVQLLLLVLLCTSSNLSNSRPWLK